MIPNNALFSCGGVPRINRNLIFLNYLILQKESSQNNQYFRLTRGSHDQQKSNITISYLIPNPYNPPIPFFLYICKVINPISSGGFPGLTEVLETFL